MKWLIFVLDFVFVACLATGCSEGCIEPMTQQGGAGEDIQLQKLPVTVIDLPPFWEEFDGLPKNGALFEMRTQEELSNQLKEVVPAEYIPEVDFSKHSVLMVLGEGYNPAGEVTCELFRLDETRYILDINIVLTWQHSPEPWGQVIQVPAIPVDAKIAVYTGYKVYEAP